MEEAMLSTYYVQPGDSLWKICQNRYGDPLKWQEIASLNHLNNPNQIFVGQELQLPFVNSYSPGLLSQQDPIFTPRHQSATSSLLAQQTATKTFGRALFFVVADEFSPLSKKFVRRVSFPIDVADPRIIKEIIYPNRYGFTPRALESNVSIAGHVKGMTNSKYLSVSDLPFGAKRHGGTPFWIDAKKLKKGGVEVIPHETVLEEIKLALKKERTRLERRIQNGGTSKSIANLERSITTYERAVKDAIRDGEHLVEGGISKDLQAIKGPKTMLLTRTFQVVSIMGVALTLYDLGDAGMVSYKEGSIKPFTREATHQATGWGASLLSAWAGAKLGGAAGTLFSVETGPGALIGGLAGSAIGAYVGFVYGPEAISKALPESIRSYIVPEEKSG